MKKSKKYLLSSMVLTACLGVGATAMAAPNDNLYTLANMERERAALITNYLDPEITVAQRAEKTQRIKVRLIDMEQMTVRDERLSGSRNIWVKKAFDNYDLSFLVHASVESKHLIIDQWLNQQGLSTDTILSTTTGRR